MTRDKLTEVYEFIRATPHSGSCASVFNAGSNGAQHCTCNRQAVYDLLWKEIRRKEPYYTKEEVLGLVQVHIVDTRAFRLASAFKERLEAVL